MIKLVLSTDAAGFAHNATVIASVLRRTASPVWIRVYTRGFSYDNFEAGRLKAEFIRCDEEVTGSYPAHVTPAVFDRLRIIRDFDDWDRVLVMDHDMVVLADLAEYFAEPFEGSLLMGRLFGPGNTVGLQLNGRATLPPAWEHSGSYPYFHMGPMMNLEAMRQEGFWDRFVDAHAAIGLDEQFSLTATSEGRIKGVDKKWNLIPKWDQLSDLERMAADSNETSVEINGIRWANGLPEGIIHWNGGPKPWHYRTRVWRPDLWDSEGCGWEVLKAGLWEKPLSIEVEPEDNGPLRSLLKRGWKVRIHSEHTRHSRSPILQEAFPDLEHHGVLNDDADTNDADMIRFGPFADPLKSLDSRAELPKRIILQGPRDIDTITVVRDLGYRNEARVVRREWPSGGPHPKVLDYADPGIIASIAAGEDLYLSLVPQGNPALHDGLPQSNGYNGHKNAGGTNGSSSTPMLREIDADFEDFIRKELPLLVPTATSILEFGPGQSTQVLAEAFPGVRITTVEKDRERYRQVRMELAHHPEVDVHHAPLDIYAAWQDLGSLPLTDYQLVVVNDAAKRISPPCKAALSMMQAISPKGMIVLYHGLPPAEETGTQTAAGKSKEEEESSRDPWIAAGFTVRKEAGAFTVLQQTSFAQQRSPIAQWSTPVELASLAEKTYVISLPERTDRLDGLRRNWEMSSMGLSFELVEGIRPHPTSILWKEMKGMEAGGHAPALRGDYVIGAVGCKRAGIRALRAFLASGAETALICQDDCRWIPSARESVALALAQLPPEWDMVYFSAAARSAHEPLTPRLVRLTGARLCTAILWKRSTAERVLPLLEECDCEMEILMQGLHAEMSAFCVMPMPAYQARSHSDIVGKVTMPLNR